MKRITAVLIIVLIVNAGCKKDKTNISESPGQMQRVMAIHDEVMPKMSTIAKLVAELKSKIDSTDNNVEYQKAMTDLQQAHKSMMDWMKGFGDRFDHEEILKGKTLTEQKKEWLDEEEEKVKVMRDKVNNSIENAENLLKSEFKE